MKHTKCPHCGSEEGLDLIDVYVTGTASFKYTYGGDVEKVYNTELEIDDYDVNTIMYCINCGEEVCTVGEMLGVES